VLEKIHRDATEGKMRTKRRDRGPELDDTDDEDDDDDDDYARIIRKKLPKRRRIDGDNLEALGKRSMIDLGIDADTVITP
jgi:mediator of replication checkpoint protein 1